MSDYRHESTNMILLMIFDGARNGARIFLKKEKEIIRRETKSIQKYDHFFKINKSFTIQKSNDKNYKFFK